MLPNMPILKTVRLLFTFYKNFIAFSLVITLSGISIYWKYGLESFTALFWTKLITFGITYFVVHTSKYQEYFYYQNLGISRLLLWSVTLAFDFLLFIILIIITHQIR